MLTAEWLHIVLYFSIEYHNSKQNIIIMLRKYFVEICELSLAKSLFEINTYKIVCSAPQDICRHPLTSHTSRELL